MSSRRTKDYYWRTPPMPRAQLVLFADSLDSRIDADHPVRLLDEILSSHNWQPWEAEYHGSHGQPPLHPAVLCKVLLFATIRGIRSSRKIEYAVKHSIDFIWLASGETIDHSTLSIFRRQHGTRLKELYRDLIGLAAKLGLAKLSELCIDATRVLANAGPKRWTQASLDRAIELASQLFDEESAKAQAEDELDDLFDDGQPSDKLPPKLADLQARRQQLEQLKEELAAQDKARRAKGRGQKPAQLPRTDPDARILPNKKGGFAPNYTPLAVCETAHGFIVAADIAPDGVEHTMMLPLLDEVATTFDVKIETAMGDGAYSTGENLRGCEERGLELLSPLPTPDPAASPAERPDLTQPVEEGKLNELPIMPQTKCFDRTAFVYVEAEDCYYCPNGKRLPHQRSANAQQADGTIVVKHHYACDECAGCPLLNLCKSHPESPTGRTITHDEYEPERRRQHERMRDEKAKQRYLRRSHIAETPYAVLKTMMDLRRFLLRGLDGVRTEWLWACTAFNVKKLITLLARLRAASETDTAVAAE